MSSQKRTRSAHPAMSGTLTCLHCNKTASPEQLRAYPTSTRWESRNGSSSPLGVSWMVREQAYNFALYSKHAHSVRLLLYDSEDLVTPVLERDFVVPRNKTGPIWHCRIRRVEARSAHYYAYRVFGGNAVDVHGRSDEAKLLLDPYAKSVFFPPGFSREAAQIPGSNAGIAPLALLNECRCVGSTRASPPMRHASDLVIYEMHVRGFTQHRSSGVTPKSRGTFEGIVQKIPYLQQLGVTAVELMPVFQFDPGEDNYWGYMPLNFFAVHHSYATEPDACAQRKEFRAMVDALHTAGIEVLLDVVYNHTTEGDQRGPTYSFRGIDGRTYYLLSGAEDQPYANFTGTGNTLNTSEPAVRQLVLDSLRYWVSEMGVDGFRFDLASVFARRADGSLATDEAPIFAQIADDPVLSQARLIAEPWDAADAYLLGHRFPGTTWMQWNAAYRDALQRFVRGDAGLVAETMTRMYGSSDLFPDDRAHALRPFQSLNYVASHDGLTLYDLVSYQSQRNWANGHDNRDGHRDFSWNGGHEGEEGASDTVLAVRKRQAKNLLCLLLLSNGTPMIRMGDEFLHTQSGNSNPYNQDNETSWLDWGRLERNADFFRFSRVLIAFRKAHPSLCRAEFWRDDVTWLGPQGAVDFSSGSYTFAFLLDGQSEGDDDLLVMVNMGTSAVSFGFPAARGRDWLRCIDTSLPTPSDIVEAGTEDSLAGDCYPLAARSVAVLLGTSAG